MAGGGGGAGTHRHFLDRNAHLRTMFEDAKNNLKVIVCKQNW